MAGGAAHLGECGRCGRVHHRVDLAPVATGERAGRWVDGPPGPAGWRKRSERRRVGYDVVERWCAACRGLAPAPVDRPDPRMAAAAGFKRYGPAPR